MSIILSLLRTFFSLLYHQFAWTYDLVAGLVSLGQWEDWVKCALPYSTGRVLEIGFGPGHLQESLPEKKIRTFGLDESPQMARMAGRRLRKKKYPVRLVRGYAQNLPFPANSFETVAATFPSEYIFDRRTLGEIRRVLVPEGSLVILPSAWITGTNFLERLAAWTFRATGQAPVQIGVLSGAIRDQLGRAGFSVRTELIQLKRSQVLVVLAARSGIE